MKEKITQSPFISAFKKTYDRLVSKSHGRKMLFGMSFCLVLIVSVMIITLQNSAIHKLESNKAHAAALTPVKNVFVIMMENHSWATIAGNTTSAPYINSILTASNSAYATNFRAVVPTEYALGYLHPSLPNYIWTEAGTNQFPDKTFTMDGGPSATNSTSSSAHLVTQLTNQGYSWKAYQEDVSGTNCPLGPTANYVARHDPFVYFDDVTDNLSSTSPNCISHVRPYTELQTDLTNNSVANYNFITPNLCHDMHSNTCNAYGTTDIIKQGDTWLSLEIPKIMNSQAYQNGGVIFIMWDEDSGGTTNNPIGLIVLSQFAKGNGYNNAVAYSHSSLIRTLEEIFNINTYLANAQTATDFSDLFQPGIIPVPSTTVSPTPTPSISPLPTPSPSSIPLTTPTPTLVPPTPTPTPISSVISQDTFQRPNQSHWGTASDGHVWSGTANTNAAFSIINNTGQIKPTANANLNVILGGSVSNAQVLLTGSMTTLAAGSDSLGAVLRYNNSSSMYKAVITGSNLIIQKLVNGTQTNLKSVAFAATVNTSYTIRFSASGTTLAAKVWKTGTTEPFNWMATVTDSTFTSGFCGIRTTQQANVTANITSFQATSQ